MEKIDLSEIWNREDLTLEDLAGDVPQPEEAGQLIQAEDSPPEAEISSADGSNNAESPSEDMLPAKSEQELAEEAAEEERKDELKKAIAEAIHAEDLEAEAEEARKKAQEEAAGKLRAEAAVKVAEAKLQRQNEELAYLRAEVLRLREENTQLKEETEKQLQESPEAELIDLTEIFLEDSGGTKHEKSQTAVNSTDPSGEAGDGDPAEVPDTGDEDPAEVPDTGDGDPAEVSDTGDGDPAEVPDTGDGDPAVVSDNGDGEPAEVSETAVKVPEAETIPEEEETIPEETKEISDLTEDTSSCREDDPDSAEKDSADVRVETVEENMEITGDHSDKEEKRPNPVEELPGNPQQAVPQEETGSLMAEEPAQAADPAAWEAADVRQDPLAEADPQERTPAEADSQERTPAEADPQEETQEDPLQEAVKEAEPEKEVPAEADPEKEAPAEADPEKEAPAEADPREMIPDLAAPAEKNSEEESGEAASDRKAAPDRNLDPEEDADLEEEDMELPPPDENFNVAEVDEMFSYNEEEEEEYRKRREARRKAAEERRKKEALRSEILGWVIPIAIAVALTLFLKSFIIINAHVPSGSMENTIMTGDNLMGYRLAYTNKDPQRGDIVIFYYPDDESQKFIKRIIGLPGETVTIQDGKIYIDGSSTPLEEDYLKEEWTIKNGPYTFEVPEDSYLMLGDNRNSSLDARSWVNTYVTRDKIIGKAMFVYWPFSDWGSLKDK